MLMISSCFQVFCICQQQSSLSATEVNKRNISIFSFGLPLFLLFGLVNSKCTGLTWWRYISSVMEDLHCDWFILVIVLIAGIYILPFIKVGALIFSICCSFELTTESLRMQKRWSMMETARIVEFVALVFSLK